MDEDHDNPEYRPFFDALKRHELRFPQCNTCGRFHWYPMPACPHCQSSNLTWTKTSESATLYAWTQVCHSFAPKFDDRIPYIIGVVEFADAPGIRFITNIVDVAPEDLRHGMTVELCNDKGPIALPELRFRPSSEVRL
jgi:uncharacterized OB-fold protein